MTHMPLIKAEVIMPFRGNMFKNSLLWVWMYMYNYLRENTSTSHSIPTIGTLMETGMDGSYIIDTLDPDFMFDLVIAAQREPDLAKKKKLHEAIGQHQNASLHNLISETGIATEDLPELQEDQTLEQYQQRRILNFSEHLKSVDISDVSEIDRKEMQLQFENHIYSRVGFGSSNNPFWTKFQEAQTARMLQEIEHHAAVSRAIGIEPFLDQGFEKFNTIKQMIALRVRNINIDIRNYVVEYIESFVGIANQRTGFKKAIFNESGLLHFMNDMVTPGAASGNDGGIMDSDIPKYHGSNSDMQYGYFPQIMDIARWAMMPGLDYITSNTPGITPDDRTMMMSWNDENAATRRPWSVKQNKFALLTSKALKARNKKDAKKVLKQLQAMGADEGYLSRLNNEESLVRQNPHSSDKKEYAQESFESFTESSQWDSWSKDPYDFWLQLFEASKEDPTRQHAGALVVNTRSWQEHYDEALDPNKHWNALRANGNFEINKLNHIKKMLKALGTALLKDNNFRRQSDKLKDISSGVGVGQFASEEMKGQECYPDLTLPPSSILPKRYACNKSRFLYVVNL